ncbi:MAG: radical SAM protein [Pseudomonadota bacterium]
MADLDLLLINPGGRKAVYQDLGRTLTAIEPPLWCRLNAGYAIDRGHVTDILDADALDLDADDVADFVLDHQPRLTVLVAHGHQPSASTQSMEHVRSICRAIKQRAEKQCILITGVHAAALPTQTLNEEACDFVCNGEGPETIHQLLVALKVGRDAGPDIEGLVWRDQSGQIRNNPPARLIADLEQDLHGHVWSLLPMERYRAHNWQCFGDLNKRQPYASIYTSLGCPYKCHFCCINAPFGVNRYRMRDPSAVIAEIDHLHTRYGVETFKIIDEMFVLNDRHVTAICEGLKAKDFSSKLNIWAYARVDTVKPERLELLRSAGIRWLALGIESGSSLVRDGAQKSLSDDDIHDTVHSIQRAGISVIGNFIFGLPDDDSASMNRTLSLARSLRCEFANFYVAMAYPGSPLYRDAMVQGWPLPSAWSGYSQHSYDCLPLPTETLRASDVLEFRDWAFHQYFEDSAYLEMIEAKFGEGPRRHIEAMTQHHLRRKILETASSGAELVR